MWIFRELVRLLFRIAVSVAIASAVAGVWALVTGGALTHTLRVALLIFGGLSLLLAGAGNTSTASHRRVSWGLITPGRGGTLVRGFQPKPGQPTLSATAVFVGTALALFVLAFVV